ncbi:proliferating cell nuclear antigen (pcna) [Hyperthermus butylicus]|uniref:DNA polymerase sliding clamp n=1 Tax=Hyperthermus butylicus (strain DSM 5456 / JCM 9403 / PLM1-5) TaxID=415426 RepID=A2BN98_HYPBU|nr:proliferating cell nuclear antigen (pcna) [Hyperthermus butylicus]ABM81459.1 DNA polymerase sliding clamp B2 [Hyperthermus butylicus DSM 5456]
MKLVFFDARIWRYIVSAISKVIEEGVFVVDPEEGFLFRAMDPSHVIMLNMRFPRDSFEVFEVDSKVELGVNFEDVAKVLRRASKEDKLEITSDGNTVSFAFIGKGYRKFTLPLLDITAEELPEPQLEFKAIVKVMSDVYRDAIKDVELIGDVIRFIASQDEFKVVSSSDIGEAEIIYTRESGSIIEMEVEDTQQASYTLEYFSDLSGAARVADTITIKFSSDMPALIEHELQQGAKFSFLIAPRVD